MKRDVHDGLEIYGRALSGCWPEFPLAQSFYGVGIELLVETANELHAVHRTITANYSVKHDLTFDMLVD